MFKEVSSSTQGFFLWRLGMYIVQQQLQVQNSLPLPNL